MKEKTFTQSEIIEKIIECIEEFCNDIDDKSSNSIMFKMALIAKIGSKFIEEE